MTYQPFDIHGGDRDSRFLITCDHAANTVPDFINGGDLGISAADMSRHIAYDVGAAGVTRALADVLGCAAVLSNFSRLVIDPNRGADDPTLLMKLSDGAIIPANRHADADEVERRRSALYDPYHGALADLAARREDTIIIAMHSFTPQMQGRAPRPWHIGVLWAEDGRYAQPLIQRLEEEDDLCVGDNEPYTGYLPGDAIDTHATTHGRPNALVEIRNDLIETEPQQTGWANRLAPILLDALHRSGV